MRLARWPAAARPGRRQIAATSAALPGVTVKPGLTMAACCANSCAAAQAATSPAPASRGTSSGGTGCSCSPCRCSGRRDVASTTRPGAADSSAATTPAAPGSCSRLSRTSRACRSLRCPVTISAAGRVPLTSRQSARAFHITSASRTAASGTKYTPCRKAAPSDDAAASASRVLPTPPVPVSVTSRTRRLPQHDAESLDVAVPADQRRHGQRKAGPGAKTPQRRELSLQAGGD